MSLLRYDSGRISRAAATPVGGVRVRAQLARTGVQHYRMPDGTTRAEYRPPEEVFSEDSLATWRGAVVTIGHPPRRVTRRTFKQDVVGFVSSAAGTQDGHWVASEVDVNADDAVAKIDTGDLCELSAGYTCDFDPTPGVTPDGQRYDGVQRNIRINHVALLPEGRARAGRDARLLLDEFRCDAAGNQIFDQDPAGSTGVSMKFVVKGKEYEAGPELQAAIGALEAESQAKADAADKAQAKADAEKARADAAEQERDKAKARADAAESAKALADTLARVKAVLPADYSAEGKTPRQIKTDAIKALTGTEVRADASDAYVDGRLDAALEHAAKAPEKRGEDYARKDRKDERKDGDALYLDEAAWAQHMANSFFGKDLSASGAAE